MTECGEKLGEPLPRQLASELIPTVTGIANGLQLALPVIPAQIRVRNTNPLYVFKIKAYIENKRVFEGTLYVTLSRILFQRTCFEQFF